ncbi:MAG: dihydrodipicolinate synthase family protein [Bryobacterales bacterium]|nr:dihydrodipicolinate synthase family protein [Bryobacterales bacterium]
MELLSRAALRGTWATVLLPVRADESVDYGALEEELAVLVASGVAGIYSNGTAGEFFTQTEDEFDRINRLLAEQCSRAGLPFQIGACHMSAQVSLDRIGRARTLEPSAMQVILPDWTPVSFAEALAFLGRAAEVAAPVPLVLYQPPHAKRQLTPAELEEAAEAIPALIGIKMAGGDAAWFEAMRGVTSKLAVFTAGHSLASGTRMGAAGSYSNAACLHPAGAARWERQMAEDPEAALDVERRLVGFLREHILPLRDEGGYCNGALDKLLAAIGGWAPVGTRLRWPYRWLGADVAERLRPVARDTVPEFFR